MRFIVKGRHKKARTGILTVGKQRIKTPNLAIVATHGKVKLLDEKDIKRSRADLLIANTFHLFVTGKVGEIKKAGGLHKWSKFKGMIMTDSGGFQVFSLGWGRAHKVGKIGEMRNEKLGVRNELNNVKIYENKVVFKYDGKKYELSPESSMKIQKYLGADIIFAFDECTSPFHSHKYNKEAMERTHRWAVRCLNLKLKTKNLKPQALFGIVQGGIYEDLRKKSAKFVAGLPFDGFGIGGSFGEKQMGKVLNWVNSILPAEKPRHLLGIGAVKDIFIAVKQGVDLFDCVIPTREGRHGVLYASKGKIQITKGIYKNDKKKIDAKCGCYVCKKFRRKDLNNLFKTDRIAAQKLATIHNIYFYKTLFKEIREGIVKGKLEEVEKKYLRYYNF